MSTKDEIIEVMNSTERAKAPDFLEDRVMEGIAHIERKKVRRISLINIAIFTGLSAVLLFVSLALHFYVPQFLWLHEVKMYAGLLLALYVTFLVARWLPSILQSFLTSSK